MHENKTTKKIIVFGVNTNNPSISKNISNAISKDKIIYLIYDIGVSNVTSPVSALTTA